MAGRPHQAELVAGILAFRRLHAALFANGRYLPLVIEGAHASHALAFLRLNAHDTTLVIVTRLAHAMLANRDVPHVMPLLWGDTAISLPQFASKSAWRDVSTGMRLNASKRGRLNLSDVLSGLPIAVLLKT